MTDSSGNIKELYAYTPYGKQCVLNSSGTEIGSSVYGNNYGFTGMYLDNETGLWYFRARYFSDELGRFISRDPKGYIDGMSLYGGYFAESFNLDPDGLFSRKKGLFEITIELGKLNCGDFSCDEGISCTQEVVVKVDLAIGGAEFTFDSEYSYKPNESSEEECVNSCNTDYDIDGDYGLLDPFVSVTGWYENNCSRISATLRLDLDKVSSSKGLLGWLKDALKMKIKPTISVNQTTSFVEWDKDCCKCYTLEASTTAGVSAWLRPATALSAASAYAAVRALPWVYVNMKAALAQALKEIAKTPALRGAR